MFIDQAIIIVHSGDGGNGCVSFRREKFVPRGGPDGGDGGNGGNIFFEGSHYLQSLLDFRYRPNFAAKNGDNGKGKNMHGKNAEDLIIKIPCGTIIYDHETGKKIKDIIEDGQRILVSKGGRGGFGNAHFATSTNQAPRLAEKGQPGEQKVLRLELKLIADVGLVGYPNAGKSTLISRISEAHPKIASYPFTTLTPNLGVVKMENWRTFIVADLPGLIEGAHKGTGLGHEFLRHIERTRLLVQIVDMSGFEERDPWDDYEVISRELELYSQKLSKKIKIIAANKMDLPDSQKNFNKLKNKFESLGYKIFPISGVSGEGLKELLQHIASSLDKLPIEEENEQIDEEIIEFSPRYLIKKLNNNIFEIEGKEVEKWVAMTDFENDEACERLHRIFQKIGIEDELKSLKINSESVLKIKDTKFNYFDIC